MVLEKIEVRFGNVDGTWKYNILFENFSKTQFRYEEDSIAAAAVRLHTIFDVFFRSPDFLCLPLQEWLYQQTTWNFDINLGELSVLLDESSDRECETWDLDSDEVAFLHKQRTIQYPSDTVLQFIQVPFKDNGTALDLLSLIPF